MAGRASLGTEATRLVLAHAFETVGLHRAELEVYSFNRRARRVYDQVGFVHEGTKRQALLWEGAWVGAQARPGPAGNRKLTLAASHRELLPSA